MCTRVPLGVYTRVPFSENARVPRELTVVLKYPSCVRTSKPVFSKTGRDKTLIDRVYAKTEEIFPIGSDICPRGGCCVITRVLYGVLSYHTCYVRCVVLSPVRCRGCVFLSHVWFTVRYLIARVLYTVCCVITQCVIPCVVTSPVCYIRCVMLSHVCYTVCYLITRVLYVMFSHVLHTVCYVITHVTYGV